MGIEYVIEYLLINIFWVYIVVRFMKVFFDESYLDRRKSGLVYLVFYGLNSAGNLLFHNPVLNLLSSIIGIFFISCVYKGSKLKKVTATFMIYAICMVCDVAVATSVGKYIIGMKITIINNILSYLLILCIELFIERYIQLRADFSIFHGEAISILGVPISSIAIICILVVTKVEQKKAVIVTALLLLFINILVFYLYDSLLRDYEQKYKNAILQQEVNEYKNQLILIQQSQKKLEGIKHDMKHHYLALHNMIKDSSKEELEKYLNEMIEFSGNAKEYVASGNRDIDSILNYMIQQARDEKITVRTKINIGQQMEVNLFDINVVLGNLLENAISAAKQSEEKKICIGMELDRGILYIDVKNTYNGYIENKDGKLITTKSQKQGHGIGLQNVEMIIEKYNGKMNIDYDEKVFLVNVMLYTTKIKK